MSETEQPEIGIINVEELLSLENIVIPEYQRPYKWTAKNVNQLIDDILSYKDKSAYRLGTIVFHKDGEKFNIVDGQQRCITLTLIAHAIADEKHKCKFSLLSQEVKNNITQYNLKENYNAITKRVADFDDKYKSFFFEKCEVVKVVLNDISEAFQFFDSQNSRGKDLEPHDLLKAFHLREMGKVNSEEEIMKVVKNWEDLCRDDSLSLSELFSKFLYRIKTWSKGKSVISYTKNDIDSFKGISAAFNGNFPYSNIFKIAHCWNEYYNNSISYKIIGGEANYPFQIDQAIINGKRFFEMTVFYKKLISSIKENSENDILELIDNYEGASRIGDNYVKNAFYCALIYYIDRFAFVDIDKVINKIFVWAYRCRLLNKRVDMRVLNNYILSGKDCDSIFQVIRDAIVPSEIINMKIDSVGVVNMEIKEIKDKFETLGY